MGKLPLSVLEVAETKNVYVLIKYVDENGLEVGGPHAAKANEQKLLNDIRRIVAEEVRAALEKREYAPASNQNQWPFCPVCNKVYASAAYYSKPIIAFGNLPLSDQYPQYCFGLGSCAPAECSECHWMIPAGLEHDCTRLKEIRRGL
jgi:hypothetical protein